jgi:hypothetical protein
MLLVSDERIAPPQYFRRLSLCFEVKSGIFFIKVVAATQKLSPQRKSCRRNAKVVAATQKLLPQCKSFRINTNPSRLAKKSLISPHNFSFSTD